MKTRIQTTLLTLLLPALLWAQGSQERYLQGKEFLRQGNYAAAEDAFRKTVHDPVFDAHARFYFGLCAYKQGKVQQALDAWKELAIKHPTNWPVLEEANFWICYAQMEQGDHHAAVGRAQSISDNTTRKQLYQHGVMPLAYAEIKKLQAQYPADKLLAEVLIRKGMGEPLADSERAHLGKLMDKFGITPAGIAGLKQVKKPAYDVAVMLPFLFGSMKDAPSVMRNTLVMELYQGMLLAQEHLRKEGIQLNLHPFDTKRNLQQTQNILADKNLQQVDLIVGPLYPEPIVAVNAFSARHQINMLNPVSANSQVMRGNPYAFMLKPSNETMARRAAEYAAKEYKKPEVHIYFEQDRRDSAFANTYKQVIESLGFTVTEFKTVDGNSARKVLNDFSGQREVVVNMSDAEANEAIRQGRQVRTRRKFDANGKQVMGANGQPAMEYYELVFNKNIKDLGHVVAATRTNLIANNLISAMETRPDSIGMIGYGEWLDFTMLSYQQLERMQVALVHPEYVDRSTEFYQTVEAAFIKKFKTAPTVFHLLGYETIWWAGHMMNVHGRYFQVGVGPDPNFPTLFYGRNYDEGNDNQVVPILGLRERKLQVINKE
jgi:tetratricopeptide (TPR) repeat protein